MTIHSSSHDSTIIFTWQYNNLHMSCFMDFTYWIQPHKSFLHKCGERGGDPQQLWKEDISMHSVIYTASSGKWWPITVLPSWYMPHNERLHHALLSKLHSNLWLALSHLTRVTPLIFPVCCRWKITEKSKKILNSFSSELQQWHFIEIIILKNGH